MLARRAALIGVFASLHITLYIMSFDLWRSWAIYLESFEGILLGPWAGFLAALIGSIVARAIKPIDFWMFGIFAEPLGVFAAGLLARGRWKPVLAIYCVMLSAYFMHPLGRQLPLWAILDILFALVLTYPTARMSGILSKGGPKYLALFLVLISFMSAVTDALVRVFLFIPMGLFSLLGLTAESACAIFIAGAIGSYIEDALAILVSLIAGTPLLIALRKVPEAKHLLFS